MLTEIDGNWLDLSEVAQIVETGDSCFIHLKGDRDSIDIQMPAHELAALVNAVKANRFVKHLDIPAALSDATMARIEILRDLLEAMDGDNNPNAAECWKGLRTHIKAKLIGWKKLAESEQVSDADAVARFVADMKSGGGSMMVPARVSPNARTFLTPKGVDAISSRARLAALHDVLTMMRARGGGPTTLADLADWANQEIQRIKRRQVSQALAPAPGTEPPERSDGPDPSQTTPEAAKPVTEHASARNGFLWAVAWVQNLIVHANDADDLFPVEIPNWLFQQLKRLETDPFARAKAMITGKTLCDQL